MHCAHSGIFTLLGLEGFAQMLEIVLTQAFVSSNGREKILQALAHTVIY
jgi:hypothetical protein